MLIRSTSNIGHDQIKMLIYGLSGSGKTSRAKDLIEYKPIVISAEAGLLCLADSDIDTIDISRDDEGLLVPKEKRITRLAEAYKYLDTKEARDKYKTVFLDSLTEIGQNLVEQLQQEYPEAKMALPMWGEYAKRMRALIKTFRDLQGYNVVMTALSLNEKDESSRRFTSVDLQGKIGTQLPQFFDEVLYLYAEIDSDGVRERKFITGNTEQLMAKDRSGRLDRVEKCDLGYIFKKIRGNL